MINEEILKQSIGGISGLWVLMGGLVTLIVGIIDGLVRPLKCN